MAAADLNPSRRALLGAALVAPVLSIAEGSVLGAVAMPMARLMDEPAASAAEETAQGNSFAVTVWDRALGSFRHAEAAVAALEGHPDEDAFGRAHDRFNAALRRLLAVPAADVAALATKLEVAVAAELADLTYAPPALAALAEDARRLSRE
jgi:hypothetical protein